MAGSDFYDHICKKECRNTHHKLVMNSLKHLAGPQSEQWRSLFLKHFELYLEGSKAPDTKFKDFRNHVLHVSDNFWGGPVKQAEKWYAQTVGHLRQHQWSQAVYAAGVLSHYYMDPFMPLHTGQTEEEGAIHRACEWSINKSFDGLIERLESTTGYPAVSLPTGDDWIKTAIHQGASAAHQHYQTFIDHYDLESGVKNPPAGLDDTLKTITAQLLGLTSVGFAQILDRAFVESGAVPVGQAGFLQRLFYRLTQPVAWFYQAVRSTAGKRQVSKIAAEYQSKGKVINALPADDRAVRTAHAHEVLKIDLTELDQRPTGPIGQRVADAAQDNVTPGVRPDNTPTSGKQKEQSKLSATSRVAAPAATATRQGDRVNRSRGSLTFRLTASQPIVDAPSIGPKTAKRFENIGIYTVADLFAADPRQTATAINVRHIQPETITLWQTQAKLACEIPQIYGHDAQILAGCGFRSAAEVAATDPQAVLSLVNEYAQTEEAKFVMRGKHPDLAEVTNWVNWSQQSRSPQAA